MPDPFLLAVLLTFVVALLGAALGTTFPENTGFFTRLGMTVGAWKEFIFEPGVSSPQGTNKAFLYFAFQMCLMLVTGHALASSPPVARLVRRLAGIPKNFGHMVLLTAFTACLMALVHWGLGLIVGAMVAREVGQQATARNLPHHYPLLGAAGYTGMMIWGGGLSGSIPLKAVKPFEPGAEGIPLAETLFSSTNFVISGALLLSIPIFCYLLIPRERILPVVRRAGGDPCCLPTFTRRCVVVRSRVGQLRQNALYLFRIRLPQ